MSVGNKKIKLTEKQKELLEKLDEYIQEGNGRLRGITKISGKEHCESGYYLIDFSDRVQDILWHKKLPTRTVNSLIGKGIIRTSSKRKSRYGADIYTITK